MNSDGKIITPTVCTRRRRKKKMPRNQQTLFWINMQAFFSYKQIRLK